MQRLPFQLSRWLTMLLTVLGMFAALLNTASAQTYAALDITPSRAEVGQLVTANWTSDTAPNTMSIDWGDGTRDPQPGTSGKASHRYTAAKTYTVILYIRDVVGTRQQVTITEATACEISADPNPAQPGKNVDIVVKFTGPADSKYGIDFGDGGVNNFGAPNNKVASFKHTYQQAGAQVVVLSDLVTQRPLCRLVVNVAASQPTLSLDPSPANVGQTVTATLGNLSTFLSSASLDWGDGTVVPVSSSTVTLKHAYQAAGAYVVKLDAERPSVIKQITILDPTACEISADPSPAQIGKNVDIVVKFTGSAGSKYILNFGDGSNQAFAPSNKAASFKHTYQQAGPQVLVVSDLNERPLCRLVLNVAAPTPTLSLDPNPALVGQTVTANLGNLPAFASGGATLDWGDGSVVPVSGVGQATLKHAYTGAGVYVVKLNTGNTPVVASITIRAPTPTLSLDPSPASIGQQVTASMGNLVPSFPYSLDWGDGTVVPVSGGSGSATAKHAYTLPGVYVVKLSADGVAPVTVTLNVTAPTATLSLDPNPALVGQTVTASIGSLVPSLTYSLDWGDGSVVPVSGGNGSASAKHAYPAPGTYLVKLVRDGAAPVTASINVRPPNAALTVDPNPALVGQEVTASMSSLLVSYPYTLDWGDGTAVPVTGNGKATAKHKYAAPSIYVVKLTADGVAPVIVNVSVRPPAPTLSADPNPAEVGQSVTASMGNLAAGLSYSLDWGDGASVPVSGGNGSASAKHSYAAPGVYVVKLSTEGAAPATVSLNVKLTVPTLSLDPNPANVREDVSASIGNLVPNFRYSLDWGDGTTVPISGNTSASAKHKFTAPGVYVVKLTPEGGAPVVVSLNVKVPVPTLDAQPNPARVGENVTATPGNLIAGLSYTLDWGDGTTTLVTGPLKHQYAATGLYVLKLSVDGAAPATATVKVNASLTVDTLTLHFTKPGDKPNLMVLLGSKVDAALELDYSGQGQLTGELQLDGTTLSSVSISATKGKTHVTFPIPNLPTGALGVHTLIYVPAPAAGEAPVLSTPPAISYTVRPAPTELEIDGFIFKITSISNPDFAAFAGKASHTLVVGGVEAFKDVQVSFSKLVVEAVSDERVHVTSGEISMNLNTFKTVPLPAGLGGFQVLPNNVQFTPISADFSGQVSLAITCEPPPSNSNPFRDRHDYLPAHPTILDIVSRTNEVLYGDPINILNGKGLLPVFASPVTGLRGQGQQVVIRAASTRTPVMAQAGAASLSASNSLGHSQDFRFSTLQGGLKVATAVSASGVLLEATKYCRPDPKFTYPIKAALKPDSGDLYGSASADVSALKVPTTPLTFSGSTSLTLDLSASQTADSVASVLSLYDAQPSVTKPPEGAAWMGVVLDKAKVGFNAALTPPTTATLRSGYTFSGDLGAGNFTDRGWIFTLKQLSLVAVENHMSDAAGAASAKIPLFEKQADVAITLAGGDFHYALTGELSRDFGKSDLSAGGGAWVERGQTLDLQITANSWDLKELSTLRAGAQGSGIASGTTLGQFTGSYSGGFKYVGNVPAISGGSAASNAISSSVSANAPMLTARMLGIAFVSTTGGTKPAAGGSSLNTAQLVSPTGSLTFGSAGQYLKLPSASLSGGVATLNTLTFTADGSVRFGESALSASNQKKSADGLSKVNLPSSDFKLFGQTFNVTAAVIGRSGNGYALGLDGKQQLSSLTPSVPAQMRYLVSGGVNRRLDLHTDAFSKQVDPNATMRVEGSDVSAVFTTTGMLSSSDVRASLGSLTQSGTIGLRQVTGGYELTIKGGLDTGQGASVMKVTAEALFGLTNDPYFYVKAAIDSRTPIVTVLGAFNLYGFTGGIAYNMKWPDNASIPQYALAPTKTGTHGVQIIGGITAAFEEGSSLHFKAIFKIDTQRGFELTADGWILTPMNQGVFGGKAAQARILISVTGDGFDMLGCLGPQYLSGLNCNDLSKFTLAGVVDITAWLHVRIADQKFVKVGTYGNPISAKLNIPFLGGVESRGYLIIGQAFENGDRKDNKKGTGLFTGYAFDAKFGIAGSLGRIGWPFKCYPWGRASLGYGMNIDVGFELDPVRFDAAAGFHADLDVRAGCAKKDGGFANKQEIMNWNGKSIGIGLGADINGHLSAFNPIAFNGDATLHVDLPIIPTFNIHASVSF
ncbi:hypothetical protein FNU79_03140 [Deinococcus detaillensis]|uniref:PKD domain-containing protein n=1 Tax=Deinococcus detaillensis TaxID=2592048 RepID=A0A553V5J3_9DEIO|nr:hypothetical protein [Deinococcus detaillensis]TSA87491.1 hypothetical protein FNU79_03140 [Deinococcus detaillensis]